MTGREEQERRDRWRGAGYPHGCRCPGARVVYVGNEPVVFVHVTDKEMAHVRYWASMIASHSP